METLEEAGLKVPKGQPAQVRLAVAVPAAVMYVPPPQMVHGTHAVAGSASWSQVSAAQATAGLVPPAQCWPATHGAHVAGELGVAAAVCTVPGRHSPAQAPLEHTGASPPQCVLFKQATHIPVATSHCGLSPPQSPMPRHSTHSIVATLHSGVATPHGGQGPWSRAIPVSGPMSPWCVPTSCTPRSLDVRTHIPCWRSRTVPSGHPRSAQPRGVIASRTRVVNDRGAKCMARRITIRSVQRRNLRQGL